MKKVTSVILSLALVIGVSGSAVLFSGCSENAMPVISETTVSYDELKAKVDAFDEVYAYYCFNKSDELKMYSGEGFTPLGNSCSYVYITNTDGMNPADLVKSCTIDVYHDDGSSVTDEYFAVDASTLFVARTECDSVGAIGTMHKYICYNGTLYEINEADSILVPVDKADTLDMYLDFSDIVELYGQP